MQHHRLTRILHVPIDRGARSAHVVYCRIDLYVWARRHVRRRGRLSKMDRGHLVRRRDLHGSHGEQHAHLRRDGHVPQRRTADDGLHSLHLWIRRLLHDVHDERPVRDRLHVRRQHLQSRQRTTMHARLTMWLWVLQGRSLLRQRVRYHVQAMRPLGLRRRVLLECLGLRPGQRMRNATRLELRHDGLLLRKRQLRPLPGRARVRSPDLQRRSANERQELQRHRRMRFAHSGHQGLFPVRVQPRRERVLHELQQRSPLRVGLWMRARWPVQEAKRRDVRWPWRMQERILRRRCVLQWCVQPPL